MANRFFTVMIVPERSARVVRVTLSKRLLVSAAVLASSLVVVATMMAFHYAHQIDRVRENEPLRQANRQLAAELATTGQQLATIQHTVDRLHRFDTKLRVQTQLAEPERSLAIGPLAPRPLDPWLADQDDDLMQPWSADLAVGEDTQNIRMEVVSNRVESLLLDALDREESMRELEAFFEDRKAVLDSIPSVMPVQGWLTSSFGFRSDPYTSDRHMHNGVDIANAHGTSIVAPGDATVVLHGNRGGFGLCLILDHGFGVRTVYAHLSASNVTVGDTVRRGQKIADMGNSGRSTGPHLHYEVRVHGIPVNPKKYILFPDFYGEY